MYGAERTDDRPTLIYCRESRDENSENYQRIETQRDILLRFCQRRGFVNVVDVILDDDMTGTSFRRFDPILERVRRGEIRVLVFKDASRLGRNLKESLIFTETVENWGGEIVFESEEYNEDFFPLKAWFNEQRAKEDSLKIRRVLRHKMETGTLLVKPFYGYRRGKNGAMEPDGETAEIVKWIFAEARQGRGSGEIAAELNARGVPTPSQSAGYANAASCWNSQHIRRIVTDPVYLGTMIHNRTVKKSFKNKRTVHTPEPEWIVLENRHEPLVSRELYDEVQRTRRKFKRDKYTGVNRPFSGLLRCGRCGRGLVLRKRGNRPDAYVCGKYHAEGAVKDEIRPDYGCRAHHVRESVLYDAAKGYIQALLRTSNVDLRAILRRTARGTDGEAETERLEKALMQVRGTVSRIYDDKLSGVISEALFVRKYAEYAAQERELSRRLAQLRRTTERKDGLTELQMEDIIKGLNEKAVTREQIRLLFDRIVVFEAGELREKDGDELGLSRENFALLRARGGIVFVENADPPIGGMNP